MRPLTVIICLFMIVTCYAFKIASIEEFYQREQNGMVLESPKLQESVDHRLPVSSEATSGLVSRHKVTFTGFSNPIFIIGDDPRSKQWLKEHAEELKRLHALGFITNIENPQTLKELQAQSDLPLLPSNVDDLMLVLSESHYPLLVSKGVVWQ